MPEPVVGGLTGDPTAESVERAAAVLWGGRTEGLRPADFGGSCDVDAAGGGISWSLHRESGASDVKLGVVGVNASEGRGDVGVRWGFHRPAAYAAMNVGQS